MKSKIENNNISAATTNF